MHRVSNVVITMPLLCRHDAVVPDATVPLALDREGKLSTESIAAVGLRLNRRRT